MFRYEVQDGDNLTGGIAVPADAIAVAGAASIVDATGPAGHAAILGNAATTLTDGSTVLAAAPDESLTAGFEPDSVPDTHDGETAFALRIGFDDGSGQTDGDGQDGSGQTDGDGQDGQQTTETLVGLALSESSFLVTGGQITEVARLAEGDNRQWTVSVAPESLADVSISLGPTVDCADAGAVCTAHGRKLANGIHAVVKGPPGLSVADARVAEGPDATMDFTVTLSRALEEAVSVDYATADGTATAGEDYTAATGTLTFEPGEIARTVSVEVLDDSHDDDGETFTLTLSNPSGAGAYLAHDTATGTIQNSDPMPKAWIARFGRTVSDHVIDAIQGRLRDRNRQTRESHFTLGGLRVDSLFGSADDAAAQPYPGAAGEAPWPGEPAWMARQSLQGGFGVQPGGYTGIGAGASGAPWNGAAAFGTLAHSAGGRAPAYGANPGNGPTGAAGPSAADCRASRTS